MPSCAHFAYTHYIILDLQISVIVSSIPTAGILLLFHLPVRRSTVNLLHGRMIVRPQIRHISGHGFPLWEFMTCACWTELSFPICKSKRLQIIISIQTFLYRFDPTVSVSGLHNSHRGNWGFLLGWHTIKMHCIGATYIRHEASGDPVHLLLANRKPLSVSEW